MITRLGTSAVPAQVYGDFGPKTEVVVAKSGTITRLAVYATPGRNYGDFSPKTAVVADERTNSNMSVKFRRMRGFWHNRRK